MGYAQIFAVDLDKKPCATGKCDGIHKLIEDVGADRALDVINASVLADTRTKPVPRLLALRSACSKSLVAALKAVRSYWDTVPVLGILCGAWQNPREVQDCLDSGLDDFITCPASPADLIVRTRRLLSGSVAEPATPLGGLRRGEPHLSALVGESPCFLRTLLKLPRVAHSNATVLLTGETGTGKELFARAIHYASRRSGHPFIPVNCGSLPDQLFENELFGHVRGAYTDASTASAGLLTAADGGTLFLDEVDALSPASQVKLLRFLQDHEYRPLGSTQTVTANIRVIAATNANLRERVLAKHFRDDLFHRINVLSVEIPPLRERMDDVPQLAAHFVARFAAEEQRGARTLSRSALDKLMRHSWPGNVRELESVVQRAVVMSRDPVLEPADLDVPVEHADPIVEPMQLSQAKKHIVDQFERAYLIRLLSAHRGNLSSAAREAGKERRTFQRLVRKYAIEREAYQ